MDAVTYGGEGGAAAIRRINEALRGPVAEVLVRCLPELRHESPSRVYDRTFDDLGILQRAFALFRGEQQHFRPLLVDARKRPVTDETTPLFCGRSLQEVVAMIVRTAAKRYFRRAIPARKDDACTADASSSHSSAELYAAIRDYLLYEWQVPLVPAYAELTPSLVRRLGARLLSMRDLAAVYRLARDQSPQVSDQDLGGLARPDSKGEAEARDGFERLLTQDRNRLRSEAFAAILVRPDIRASLPTATAEIHLTDVIRSVGAIPARLVVTGLTLSPEQLAVFLINAHHQVGWDVFLRLFGHPGQAELVLRVVQRALVAGIGPASSLAECADFAQKLFARASQGPRPG